LVLETMGVALFALLPDEHPKVMPSEKMRTTVAVFDPKPIRLFPLQGSYPV
jgi:hypothetical protein